jgi:hypothetical protein
LGRRIKTDVAKDKQPKPSKNMRHQTSRFIANNRGSQYAQLVDVISVDALLWRKNCVVLSNAELPT